MYKRQPLGSAHQAEYRQEHRYRAGRLRLLRTERKQWNPVSYTHLDVYKRQDYNARKKAQSDEIDRILDKLKKSGYESLTTEEKKSLFDASKR